jgi:hypothetical protein
VFVAKFFTFTALAVTSSANVTRRGTVSSNKIFQVRALEYFPQ